jgi:hypothetical protein
VIGRRPAETLEPSKKLHDSVARPDQHVGTSIDSVRTLPPEATKPTINVTPPAVTGPSVGSGGPIPPVAAGSLPPAVRMPTGRASGFRGGGEIRSPIMGRVAEPPAGTSGAREPMGPVGRAAATGGQAGLRGPASAAGKTPVARSITGGMPRVGGTPAGRVGGTGAARTGGVVGGKPTTEAAQGVNGSRIPRGTVIGGEAASKVPKGSERLGRRGAVGAPEQEGAGQAPRRLSNAPNGVAGMPRGKVSGARKGALTASEIDPERAPLGNHSTGRAGGDGRSRDERATRDNKGPSRKERRDESSTD